MSEANRRVTGYYAILRKYGQEIHTLKTPIPNPKSALLIKDILGKKDVTNKAMVDDQTRVRSVSKNSDAVKSTATVHQGEIQKNRD